MASVNDYSPHFFVGVFEYVEAHQPEELSNELPPGNDWVSTQISPCCVLWLGSVN
jgi:hypothetical protein